MAVLVNTQAGGAWGQAVLRIDVPDAFTSDPTERLRGALVNTTHRAGQRLEQNALQAYSRYPRIARGFQQATTLSSNTVSSSVWNPLPLFALREFDTKAHVITAKHKPYLHFFGRLGWVRKYQVHHPGTTGLNALTPLLNQEVGRFEADLETALREVLGA